ncbi:MAG TPA: twin-arginine translocase TatA/TatE family subunit [Dehalococcoidia bacterium]|nr:twin-arginine translocase TatA/TatE family subunit [Dehalococcoidia bacterium]
MSFLGIGLPEVVLVVIIAAIVVGPQRLPEVAVQLARAIRYLRGYATDATAQLRAEIDELTRDYQQVRQELQEFRQSVGGNLSAIGKDLSSITEEVDRTLKESQPIIEPPGEPPPKERQPKPPDP